MWTIPNTLSALRLVVSPIMLGTAIAGMEKASLVLFAFAFASDTLDGLIARATGTCSEFGARLDSAADCVFYLIAPFAAIALYPWFREAAMVTLLGIFFAYLVPVAVGFFKFRKLTSYHTTLARVAGVLLYAGFVVALVTHHLLLLRVALVVLVLSAVEEIAITCTLPVWRARIPSVVTLLLERRIGRRAVEIGADVEGREVAKG